MDALAGPPDNPARLSNPTEAWELLQQVSLVKFLNHDTRPAFILDLHEYEHEHDHHHLDNNLSRPVFINQALCQSPALFHVIGRAASHQPESAGFHALQDFLAWAWTPADKLPASHLDFAAFSWNSMTLDDRWRVVVAVAAAPFSTISPAPGEVDRNPHSSAATSVPSLGEEASIDVSQPLRPQARDFFLDSFVKKDTGLADKNNATRRPSASISPDARLDARAAKRNAELLAKIAAFDNVAIFFGDVKGQIIFCNDAWYEMCEHPRDQINAMGWTQCIDDDELPKIMEVWTRILVHQESVQYQARLKRRWVPSAAFPDAPSDFPTWISGSAYPDVSIDGKVVGVCGVMTDITEQKWTEHRMREALSHAEERARLVEQLSLSTKQVINTENRFRRLSDMMPIAIWVCDDQGRIIYGNDVYREYVPGSGDATVPQPWWDVIPESHTSLARDAYRRLMEEHEKVTFEIPFRKVDKDSGSVTDETRWVLISAYPELDEHGQVAYMTGCLTDINHLKLAEQIQGARALDAEESKRKLEHFIDMTSHEMRNPLSAIVHSAEEILSSLCGDRAQELANTATADAVEAAETIIHCADHSTRIVDDILLVSKLDSGLLNITPTVVQPAVAIKQALKMFDGEMKAADINRSFTVDESFSALKIDWLLVDINRVLQVFVNLITNAIKFTRPEDVRRIDTCIKASSEKPHNDDIANGVHFLDPQTEPSMATNIGDEVIYIRIEVSDTGCGLTETEQGNLFQRFSQAGKRTHIKYGGTGLGLFISRQLCEMQGGQIGVRSAPKQGSTFSFYVMAHRAAPPVPVIKSGRSIESLPESKLDTSQQKDTETPQEQPRMGTKRSTTAPASQLQANTKAGPSNESREVRSLSPESHWPVHHSPSEKSSTVPTQQPTILLVEDNIINQKVVAKKLRAQGYTVLVANHGLEALNHISESSLWSGSTKTATTISLILLDMEMPVMDGLSCIRRIRESEECGEISCHIPVIAVTANARQEQINQAKDAGMDDVVTKPFRMNQLFAAMTRLIEEFPTLP